MGRQGAESMAELLPLRQALAWHLQSNHYPPHPDVMIDVAVTAIEAYAEGDQHRVIALPEGITFRGSEYITAHEAVESLHLEPWVWAFFDEDWEDDDEWEDE